MAQRHDACMLAPVAIVEMAPRCVRRHLLGALTALTRRLATIRLARTCRLQIATHRPPRVQTCCTRAPDGGLKHRKGGSSPPSGARVTGLNTGKAVQTPVPSLPVNKMTRRRTLRAAGQKDGVPTGIGEPAAHRGAIRDVVAAPSPVAPLPPSNPGVQTPVPVPRVNKMTRRRTLRAAGQKIGVPTGIRTPVLTVKG